MLQRLAPERWNYSTAAHLLNRAGFGGTPVEIQKLAALGLDKAVDSLLDFGGAEIEDPGWAKPDPDRRERLRELRDATPEKKQEIRKQEQREQREHLQDLRYWWLEQMVFGPHPLQEKLALFWHGHFATSAQKVKNGYFMWRQNDIFRRHGAGNWLTLLTEVSKDPAMLIWLDQAQSRKEHPNENFAREVMELFTLGEGHYTEKDITEAARALTGWSLDRQSEEFIYRSRWHDEGTKTVLGQTGTWNGDDILSIIVKQPQSARFICRKLWVFFGNDNPPDELIEQLAATFHAGGSEFKPLLRAIFTSADFYSDAVVAQQVKSPVQWLVGSVRLLQRELPPPQLSANALRMLGQDLLLPPNVKGWDGGLSWITTNNLMNRYNFADYLVLGENPLAMQNRKNKGEKGGKRGRRRIPPGVRVNASQLFPDDLRATKEKLADALQQRFLQRKLRPEHESSLLAYLDAQGEIDDLDVLHAIRLVLSTPEFQLT
jgi:uncharacterized protein (DUF1800 family)